MDCGMSVTERGKRIEMVELTSRGARQLVWAYFITMVVLAIWTIDGVRNPYPSALAVFAFACISIIFTFCSANRLPVDWTWVVIGLSVVSTGLALWQLKPEPGYASWVVGAAGTALFFVGLRGRLLLSWVGFALLALVIVAWGITVGPGLESALLAAARQAAVLIVGTLFATGLRRTGDEVERLTDEATDRAISESQQTAVEQERRERLLALGEFVTPLLARLASGAKISARERIEFALAEAELRDGLRARALQVPVIAAAAREARRRGVEVVLLDDSDSSTIDPDHVTVTAARIAELLDAANDGRVTARLLPAGRDAIATIVVDGAEHRSESIATTPRS